jgi:hypothetical protein
VAKIKTRTVYTTSDGIDHNTQIAARMHERKIVVSKYFLDYEQVAGEDDLGLTERQAQALVKFLAVHVSSIYNKLEADQLI